MAIILKSGVTKSTPATSLPLRSTTIKVLQTGLIHGLTNELGDAVGNINMGYMGDHCVSRIYVELWKNAVSFEGYEAALVFYNTTTSNRHTLNMSNNGVKFYLDIPEAITLEPYQYQVYFILREKLDLEDNIVVDSVGVEDDPAYREVFVSDVCNGSVDSNSGRKYIAMDFDWNLNIHNYNIGTISIDDKVWNHVEGSNTYSTDIYLGGLNIADTNAFSGNVVVQPEKPNQTDINVIYNSDHILNINANLDTKTLSFSVEFDSATEQEIESALDNIYITYPVVFVASLTDNLKKPIKVVHDAYNISVEDNTRLGMKHDSYVTPINVSGLINPYMDPTNIIKKYVIFEQDSRVYVCQADSNNYCWIPAAITERAGRWNVSFAVRNETIDYCYYTGVLSLPVTDNALFKEDIDTDSTYTATLDLNGSYLYDGNDYVVYAQTQSQSQVRLDFTGQKINQLLGWVDGLAETQSYDNTVILNDLKWVEDVALQYTSEEVKNQLDQVTTLSGDVQALRTAVEGADVTDMRNDVTELQTNVNNITPRLATAENDITVLKESLAKADVTKLNERMESAEKDVLVIKEGIRGLNEAYQEADTRVRLEMETKDSALESRITEAYQAADQSILSRVEKIEQINATQTADINLQNGKIVALEAKDIDIQNQIYGINETLSDYGLFTSELTKEIENRVKSDEQLKQQVEKIYLQNEFTKEESGVLITKEEKIYDTIDSVVANTANTAQVLQQNIDNEENRAMSAESRLEAAIGSEEQRAVEVENSLTQQINNINADITNNIKKDIEALKLEDKGHNDEIESHTGRLDSVETQLNTSVIRNEYTLGVEKTYVAKIVFLRSEAEYEALENKDPNTLYLIQEEE